MMDYQENLQKVHEYVRALEDERRKIEMFQRELPLCLEIVTQAIEKYKQQLSGTSTATTTTNGHSDCSEQTTSCGPVFEEFIPIKRVCDREEDEVDEELESHKTDCNEKTSSEKKSDWLRSVQLWNQSPDPPSTATNKQDNNQISQARKVEVVEVKRNGAFHPFQKDNKCNSDGDLSMEMTAAPPAPLPAPAASACSSAEKAGRPAEKKDEGGQGRKARRCWSPELHRRFLSALEQLGGSHVATPKQIRDLMKVDGLTNDEVKSHLQKYRLHSRRPTPAVHNNATTQAPQFVVVGGIWVPPTGPTGTTGIYAPQTPGQPQQGPTNLTQRQQNQNKQSSQSAASSHSEGGVARCNSPATSSSTHAITPSPAY